MTTGAAKFPSDPLDAALQIAAALDRSKISYALGGALAYGFWAVPRGTVDVDVDVFASEPELSVVFRTLESLGIQINEIEARAQEKSQGMFIGRWGPYRIDIFTPSIAFSREAEATRVRRSLGSGEAWILSAEAIAVFKLLFFRTKDLADLERLVAIHVELQVDYVRRHVAEMMGEDDERVTAWDRIVASTRAAALHSSNS
jgi:hypothetical protein